MIDVSDILTPRFAEVEKRALEVTTSGSGGLGNAAASAKQAGKELINLQVSSLALPKTGLGAGPETFGDSSAELQRYTVASKSPPMAGFSMTYPEKAPSCGTGWLATQC